ncbi:MAG: carboxypeptidase-like regulatory domain-containing protein, partial [Candidatus Berkelbacteria bacterium]|nr:carboxypeptidase-like regulatory domain-containing protein [Candidatus Berkelbacteria bacterium]
ILISGIIALVVIALVAVGLWAYKSGKLAGLADVGPAEIDVYTKDSSGNPVGFVDILVSSDGQNYFPASPPLQTQSNGHVIYSDPVFQNHTLYLKASKPYHSVSPEYRQLSVSSGNKYNTDFTVTSSVTNPSKGKLKGKVLESDTNNPINGAYIYVSNTKTGFSNSQGDYGVIDINPGTYSINVTRNDYQDAHGTAVITANQETTLNFTLTKKAISPSPSRSSSASPSPSTQPDRNNFIFTAEVIDQDTQQLIKDVKVSIKINPSINGAVETTNTTKDAPVDTSKYGNNNLLAKVPYPSDCYSYNTKYTVEFSHPVYETRTLPDFYCSDIHFSDNLQIYFYNAHKISLKETVPKNILVTGRVFNKETGDLLDGFEVMLEYENGKQRFSRTTAIEYTKIGNYNFDVWDFSSKETYKVKLDYDTGTWTGDFSGEMKFNPEEVEFTYQDGKIRYDPDLRRFVATIDFEVDLGYLKVIVKEGGGKPLEKARVELFDSGFGFSETQFTDSEGMTRFNSLKRFKYCHDSGTLGSRGIKLSAKGYVTKIKINEDYCHAGEVVLDYYLGKIDTSKGSLIKGSVYGIEKGWGSHYLEGAKVSLWSDLKGDAEKSTTTDSRGDFEFNKLGEGQYLVSAFHYDYKSTATSSQAIKLEDGEQVDIVLLRLEKVPLSGVLDKLVVAVYRKSTLEPVRGIMVTATTSENITWREYTDFKGEASFGSVFLGESLLIKIIDNDNKVLDERKVIVPLDYYDLDDKDRATFWSQL